MTADIGVVIVAAGKSARFTQNRNADVLAKKPFSPAGGRATWLHSAEKFFRRQDVAQIVLVVAPEDRDVVERVFHYEIQGMKIDLADGGAERYESVQNALRRLRADVKFVAVHDAARPCVRAEEIDAVFRKARETGAAILAAQVVGSLKRANQNVVGESVSRDNLWEAHTPQVFERVILERAYDAIDRAAPPTDDSQLVAALGRDVYLVPGKRTNIKITTRDDLELAELYLAAEKGAL